MFYDARPYVGAKEKLGFTSNQQNQVDPVSFWIGSI